MTTDRRPDRSGDGMTPDEYVMVQAWKLARAAHVGQTDKAGNDYYSAHVADVAHRVGDDLMLRTVAYLHDVVEDTHWSLDALAAAGFPSDVLAAVDAITHRPNEPRDDYYTRVGANPVALAVKLADVGSNADPARMALLDQPTRDRLTAKYDHARWVLTR